jgi:DNA-directed RNA polymerase specialized sigma24 family protein
MSRQVPVDRPEAAFARLLSALDPEPDRAGQAYEHLRRALIRFFECRNAHPADECADITLDRLERKLGEATPILDVHAFAYGIARLVMFERLRRPVALPLHDAGDIRAPEVLTAGDQREAAVRRCFDGCLAGLPEDSQALVLRYYELEGRARIEARRALAITLGLTDNALRIRVQRLRDRLEACLGTCLSGTA